MKLYMFPVAPNPTKVRLYIAEKRAGGAKLDIDEAQVNLREQEQQSEDHLKRNPLAKLPVLETDDGEFLTESLAIIEYLEELFPEPTMFGDSAFARARTREFERIIETRFLRIVAEIVHAKNSPLGLPPNPAVAEHFLETLPKTLDYIDERLSDGRPFMMGERPTIPDFTMASAIQFGKFAELEVDPKYANIVAWDARFRERDSAKQVIVL